MVAGGRLRIQFEMYRVLNAGNSIRGTIITSNVTQINLFSLATKFQLTTNTHWDSGSTKFKTTPVDKTQS